MGSVRHIPRQLAGAFAIAVVGAALAAPSATASAIAGATYNGTVAGGSTITFAVSADGAGITNVSAPGPLEGNTCSFTEVGATYPTPLPIVNNAFADTSGTVLFAGSFPGAQSAEGTLRVNSTSPPACDTGNLTWSATTTALPPPPPPPPGPSPECVKAEEGLATARQAVRKARRRVKAAATAPARQRAKRRLRTAEARLRQARARQAAAC
jgi:hypothetical protein